MATLYSTAPAPHSSEDDSDDDSGTSIGAYEEAKKGDYYRNKKNNAAGCVPEVHIKGASYCAYPTRLFIALMAESFKRIQHVLIMLNGT